MTELASTLRYASRMDGVGPSILREFARVTLRPGMISFAGGLPAAELFPVTELQAAAVQTLEKYGRSALQYNDTAGNPALRSKIAARMTAAGAPTEGDNILVLSGSQQGLEFAAKLFLDPGDVVICERPTYLGATAAFNSFQAGFADVAMDDDGMVMDELLAVLESNPRSRIIYVVPDFQNPTGKTWSLERRKALVEIANRYDLIVVEDSPYGALRFEGEHVPPIKAFDTEGRVLFLGTFSKIFCPGFRIGWLAASSEVIARFNILKGNADLHTNSLAQAELNEYLEMYDIEDHIARIRSLYRSRRDLMLGVMAEKFPKSVKYNRPAGGMFTWAELPQGVDTRILMNRALERNVAFVPGAPFHAVGGGENTMRLNYSSMPEDRIVAGLDILAEVLAAELSG